MKKFFLYSLAALLFVALVVELCAKVLGEPSDVERELRFLTVDRELGWANRPGTDGEFASRRYRYRGHVTFDSLGLRDNANSLGGEPEKRILFIGDSTTTGMEVDNEQTYCSILERLFREHGRRVRVFNAGVRGYGTDQSLLQLRRLLPVLHPDIVVYMTGVYAFQQLTMIKNWYRMFSKPVFALSDNRLKLLNSPVQPMDEEEFSFVAYQSNGYEVIRRRVKPPGLARWLRKHSFLYAWIDGYYFGHYRYRDFLPPQDEPWRAEILGRLFVEMKKSSPRFFATGFTMEKGGPVPQYDLFQKQAAKNRVPFLDIRQFFQPGIEYKFELDGHWNQTGHRQAAEALYRLLADKI